MRWPATRPASATSWCAPSTTSSAAGAADSPRRSTCGRPPATRPTCWAQAALQTKLYGIASGAFGKFSPHLNAGYTYSTHGALPDVSLNNEWNYTAGFDVAVSPRLTLIVDVLGRSILDQGRLREADRIFEFVQAGPGGTGGTGGGGGGGGGGGRARRPRGRSSTTTRREFRLEPGNLNLAIGNTGVRFNPFRKMLVSANLLFALTEAGLRDRVTPVISVDYAF